MLAKKIAILNQKGGVGKTTVSVNLAYGLAKSGNKTLLIDLDPQAQSCDYYCNDIDENLTISQVLKDRRFDINKTIIQARVNNDLIPSLFIIPSTIQLAATKEEIYGRNHVLKFLDVQLEKILSNFDYIILDCPPDLGTLTTNAVYTADLILIPIDYDRKALKGVSDLFATINDVKEIEEYNFKILRNSYDAREKIMSRYIDGELEPLKDHLLKIRIRATTAINQAGADTLPIYVYAPNSSVVEDYDTLVKELING